MIRHYRKYTDEDIIKFSEEVFNISALLKKLGLQPRGGGNQENIKKHLQRLNVNTSHWTGTSWDRTNQLRDWSQLKSIASFRKRLIKQRGHKCEKCLRNKWLKKEISLELHHIDGDRTNNDLENLQLLCPNCHSVTDNYKGKKNKKKEVKIFCKCGIQVSKLTKSMNCRSCAAKNKPKNTNVQRIYERKVKDRPTSNELSKLLWEKPTTKIAEQYGVSDKAVEKWAKQYGITKPPRGYWAKLNSKK